MENTPNPIEKIFINEYKKFSPNCIVDILEQSGINIASIKSTVHTDEPIFIETIIFLRSVSIPAIRKMNPEYNRDINDCILVVAHYPTGDFEVTYNNVLKLYKSFNEKIKSVLINTILGI